MPRGGKREGAGRKPILGWGVKLSVGARCEHAWQAEKDRAVEKVIKAKTFQVSLEWEKARKIPGPARRNWLKSQAGLDYLDDVEFARREDQGIAPETETESKQRLSVSVPRPKGKQKEIIEQVALEESARQGRVISPRLVRSCWDEFRNWQRVDAQ